MDKILNSDTSCILPHIGLAITPDGKTYPCCLSQEEYKTNNGNTLADDSVINFWNSDSRQELISKLENGQKAKGCNQCWREEKAGIKSKRMRENEHWKDHIMTGLPATMYLAMGNVCNLKCRICGPDRSSKWYEENSKISFVDNIKVNLLHPAKKYRQSFEDTNDVWSDLPKLSKDVVRFDFSGGEPLYVKNNWKFIKTLVDAGYSKNQTIHFATNGSIFPENHIHLLNSFKRVQMFISIDGIGRKFNYIRHPGNFEELDKNIDRFLAVQKESNTDWYLQTTISVSAFNVWDIPETYQYCMDKGVRPFVNFVHDGRSAGMLPTGLKEKIIERLMSFNLGEEYSADRYNIIEYLRSNNANVLQWKLFLIECRKRDKFRNENFADTFPEYYKELKNYL